MRIVAVDIGGTMIKSGLWNGETFVELRETETRASEGGAALMERVKGLIHSYHDFEAIGISTAGEVNTEDGSIFYANSNIPGYTGMPVKQIMEEEFCVGCYERCASTTGLVRRVKKVDGSLDNGKKIFAAKDRPEIKEQIDAWIDDICTGLVTLCCIFNPSRIILGGGIMAQEYVLSEVNRKVKAQIAPGLRIVEIVPAKLANTAGMMGAVSLAEKLLAQ